MSYHRLLHLPYIPHLLHSLRTLFLSLHAPFLKAFDESLSGRPAGESENGWDVQGELAGWEKTWEKLLKRVESEGDGLGKKVEKGRPKGFSRKSNGVDRSFFAFLPSFLHSLALGKC